MNLNAQICTTAMTPPHGLRPVMWQNGPPAENPSGPPAPRSIRRILVADDDTFVRQAIFNALTRAGFDVNACSDGQQAWNTLLQDRYDLVVTDNEMPGLTGMQLIERIREAGLSLPIIVASGSLTTEGVTDYAQLHISAVLAKPFDIQELLTLVKVALRASSDAAAADGPAAGTTPATQPKPAKRAHRHVLIADDDFLVRNSLASVLESEGYRVDEARDGVEALARALEHEPDLVLLDLNMPVKNGWDTFERLTAKHPLVPIIIITARPNQLFTALGAGVGALLEKPMDIPALLETMNRLLAEPADQRLARLAGKKTEFHYKRAAADQAPAPPHEQRVGLSEATGDSVMRR
jgi:DNA-binding response OmpR family regulator